MWDVIIVGAGPAGCSAAMILGRSRRSVLILDEGKQRNLRSHGLHNFLTRDGILPADFLQIATEELGNYKIKIRKAKVLDVYRNEENIFTVTDHKNRMYSCRRLLLATGVTDNIPELPGMKELWGKSIFHCPFCDGYECRNSHICLYAKRQNGFGMALALCHLSKKTTLYTDGSFYLRPLQKQKLAEKGIDVVYRKISRLVHSRKTLEGIELFNGETIPCDSMFVLNGFKVNNNLLLQLGCRCTSKGAAITNRRQQSSIKGVYVAGDAAFDMHMVAVAAAEGVKAGVAIHNDLLTAENLYTK